MRVQGLSGRSGAVVSALVVTGVLLAPSAPAATQSGFTDELVVGGLVSPTVVAFAPDGRMFVAEKRGVIRTYDAVGDTTPTTTIDLRARVHDYWDRGLLGLTVHPNYPQNPSIYALYSHDSKPWGDDCPTPPGATDDGCVIDGELARITVDPATGQAIGSPHVLLTGWCQQFPSHSVGTVTFGPDGALYVGGGDGASFNFADWGQRKNPCGDPPQAAGTNLAPPSARGGALRSQSVRRPAGEPVTLNGTIVRVDPSTGQAMPGNPYASSTDQVKRRVIAYGMRNQFRFAFRPGTRELWVGDVGWNQWEEINRIPDATDGTVENFGWPCYEGAQRQAGYDGADLNLCESLYSTGQQAPYYAYDHDDHVVPGDSCPTGNSSVSGIAFESDSNYPSAYAGALFFADSTRGCIWTMQRGTNGLPSPSKIIPFVTGANVPVHLATGPDGNLYYVALGAGQVRRVTYSSGNRAPAAVATANPTSGQAPLTVQFDGSQSSDPDPGDTLTYAWDLDGDGQFDDSTAVRPRRTYLESERVTARLRVTDRAGASDVDTVTLTIGQPQSQDPIVAIDQPTTDLRWRVGQTIQFSGRASDPQDGTLPADAMDWKLTLQHCSSPTNCHAHDVRTWSGTASGSFVAPDHAYPSYLDLRLTARDSTGNTGSSSLRLEPQTVDLTFTSDPSGLRLTVGGESDTTPFTRTVIVGSANAVSAPSPQGDDYRFVSWSNGRARTHEFVAPSTPTTYHAQFVDCGGISGCEGVQPTAVRDFTVRGTGSKATVTWQPSAWPGLGGITKYRVSASPGTARDLPANARSYTFSGLGKRTYTFAVTPYSEAGAGPTKKAKLTTTALSASLAPSTIRYGGKAKLTATLERTDTGRGLPNKKVQLQARPAGSTTWTTLTTGTTSSTGKISFSRGPARNYEYRLVFGEGSVYFGATSRALKVTVRQAITGSFAAAKVKPHRQVRFTGQVKPGHPGQTVHLQYRSGGRWITSRSTTLDENSRYTFVFSKPAGTYTYRAMKYGHGDHAAGYSPARKLTVR